MRVCGMRWLLVVVNAVCTFSSFWAAASAGNAMGHAPILRTQGLRTSPILRTEDRKAEEPGAEERKAENRQSEEQKAEEQRERQDLRLRAEVVGSVQEAEGPGETRTGGNEELVTPFRLV
mmetsp:Transcript_39717/g.61997  ORF Transcript_39717/g.61997 Transcript_39717/m.61997 type:complete len:120 (-) Transcript_39717:18-377(-)